MLKRIFSIMIVICVTFLSFPAYSVYAFTPEDFLGNLSWDKMTDTEKWGFVFNVTVAECKAVLSGDAESFIKGMGSVKDFVSGHKPEDVATVTDNNITISKEYVSLIKSAIDQYIKENEPYYIGKTYAFDTADFSYLVGYRNVYNTIKNLLNESKSGFIVCAYYIDGGIWFADIDRNFADLSFIKVRGNDRLIGIYDNETWKRLDWTVYYVKLSPDDKEIETAAEFKEKATQTFSGTRWDYALTQETRVLLPLDTTFLSYNSCTIYSWPNLISKETRRVRVFNEFADFQNYTLDKRSVYVLPGYYDYEPSEITGSIEDLQKSVDDLSKALDQLLDQISKDTDESEIEELLRQILEELRNSGGSGGGGGGSGGDITVDIDLSTTNSWLSKIYAKVSQIFDKLSETVSGASDAVHTKIQESLDEIIVQLKKIKRWTAIDTVVDGVDAIADWLDLIRGVLKDAKEGAGSAVASLSSAVGDSVDLMAKKFPFSIPWDILFFVSALSAEPQVPHFEIPFNIELSALDITIDYTMELDFSQLQWLSDLSRLLLSMTYAVGLMKLTFGVTSVGKEE